MAISKLSPVLYVADLSASIDFYCNSIGFSQVHGDPQSGWSILQLNGIELMLSLPNQHAVFEKPVFTGSFYFQCTDVDQLWEAMKNKASVCYPIENFEYGMREFAIYDNNGYLLQFGQEISYSKTV